nr:uncharacterized protein LOC105712562 [Aotus nancymaae]
MRDATRKTRPRPPTLGYLRLRCSHACRALQPRPPDSSVRSCLQARGSRARRATGIRRRQKQEPGRWTPERGALPGAKRTSEPRVASAPRPPCSAPDSWRLSRPRGGAADASHRLPDFSISPFSP